MYLFSTVSASKDFSETVALSIYLVISVHISHVKPCKCVASAGSFHEDFSDIQRPPSFCLRGTYHSIASSAALARSNPLFTLPALPRILESFLILPLSPVFSGSKSSGMLRCSLRGGRSVPLVVSVALLCLSSSAVSF